MDLPDAALADAMRCTGAKTKRETVVKALESCNRQQQVQDPVASLGTWEIATHDEIEVGDLAVTRVGGDPQASTELGELLRSDRAATALACLRASVNFPLGDVMVSSSATRYGVELLERNCHFGMTHKTVQSWP